METLHELYRRLTGATDVPTVMELKHSNGDASAVDAHLAANFGGLHLEEVLAGDASQPNAIDAFIDILVAESGSDCSMLLVHHGTGVSRYIEVKNDPAVKDAVRRLELGEGSNLHLHVKGPNEGTIVRSLGNYLGTGRVVQLTGKHPYGEVYEHDDYLCIDGRVQNSDGIHARPAAEIAKTATRYKAGDQHYVEIFRPDQSDVMKAHSIMSLIMLAAGRGAELTVRVKKDHPQAGEALQAVYAATQKVYDEKTLTSGAVDHMYRLADQRATGTPTQ